METIEAIHRRKSTRAFSKKKIDSGVLQEILSSGLQAPSPKNDQPWHFLIVEKEEKRRQAADILEERLEGLREDNKRQGIPRPDIVGAFESVKIMREAPILVFVYLDPEKCQGYDDGMTWSLSAKDFECTHLMSVGAAIQNILLSATEKGVDSLWLGDIVYAYDRLHEYLCTEGCLVAGIALGYGFVDTEKAGRKNFGEAVSCLV